MAFNAYTGWGVSTLLLWFLNKGSTGKADQSETKADELNVAETQTGAPIPVVMGRGLLKAPLVTYYGGFRAERYTETYAAHANFNAWPLVFALIAQVLVAPATGTTYPGQTVTGTSTHGGPVKGVTSSPGTNKDTLITPLIQALFMWLLSWLINGRNLKTTIQKGFKYYLGYQLLACWSGPGVKIRAVYLKQNKVWEGAESREAHPAGLTIRVDDDELFGGVDEGGGFSGDIRVYLGGDAQPADGWMAEQMNADSIQEELRGLTPAYRPFVSVVVPVAYIGKRATIPEMWLDIECSPNRLGLGPIGDDANPAEVIYEVHVNTEWGLNEHPDTINAESLLLAGKKLAEEKLGVTVVLSSTTTGTQLIDSLCEHLNMARFQEPATGRWTYKLIRDDYDSTKLPMIDETMIGSIDYTRLDWRETVGRISVNYTDRNAQYEQSSVQQNDPAVIEMNGNVQTTKSYSYLYFTNAANALWAARREGRQQGYPLAAVSVTGNRRLAAFRTGDALILNWPPYGIKNMIMRVTDADLGDFVDGRVTLDLMEDVFGLGKTEFSYSGSTEWQPDIVYPKGVNDYRFLELPYEIIPVRDTFVYALAAKPDTDTQKWTVWRKPQGDIWRTTNSMVKWTPAARLVYNYAEFTEAQDMVGIEAANISGLELMNYMTDTPDIINARRGGRIMLIDDEMLAYSSIVQMSNGHWRVQGILRGVFDTVPAAHGEGATLFFLESGSYANVTTGGPVCFEGQATLESYNITTATAYGQEEFSDLKTRTLQTVRRSNRPNPPGRVRMQTLYMPLPKTAIETAADDLEMTWIHRDKKMMSFSAVSQDDEREFWTKQEFKLPDGAKYRVRVFVGDGLAKEYETEEGYFSYDYQDRCGADRNVSLETRMEVCTALAGLESYQKHQRTFKWQYPTMIDGCRDEADLRAKIDLYCGQEEIIVPPGDFTAGFHLPYNKMGIFVFGEGCGRNAAGALMISDGSYIAPAGPVAILTGQGQYRLAVMRDGYYFKGRYTRYGGDVDYYFTAAGGGSGMKLVCMGDSLTDDRWDLHAPGHVVKPLPRECYWTDIVAKKTGIEVVNAGVCGDTTGGMLARFDTDVLARRPTHCTILGGANDLNGGLLAGDVQSNILAMVEKCRAAGIEPILINCIPSFEMGIEKEDQLPALRAWQEAYCRRNAMALIDLYHTGLLMNGDRQDLSYYAADKMHLNAKGHRLAADAVLGVINPILINQIGRRP